MAEHGGGHDLALGRLDGFERGTDGGSVDIGPWLAEQVEDTQPDLGAHGAQATEARLRGVQVEAVVTHEPGEHESRSAGGVDGQRRRCAHGDEGGEPGRPGLLHHLDRRPTADEQAAARRWQRTLEQERSDDLVDGVVTADVLAGEDDLAGCGRRRRPRARRRSR